VEVHLVDGTYELFRAYYGAPAARAPGGAEVGATRGLLRSMVALLAEPGVTHVGIAFDHVIESFRNDLFPGYKTGDGIDPDLLAQFPLAELAADALGMSVWSMVEFEADDALATAAARAAADPAVDRVVICTPDKDLCQCVRGKRVVTLDRRRRRVYDEAGVVERLGVPPRSVPDWLALVGDTADGIPGIPRWGARSAATVLAEYGHLDAIPDDPRMWRVALRGAAALADSLRANRDAARLYLRLATLREDVPLAESIDDLRWRGAPRDKLLPLCEALGDAGLPARISSWQG
jgi:5'-3' exonuclease